MKQCAFGYDPDACGVVNCFCKVEIRKPCEDAPRAPPMFQGNAEVLQELFLSNQDGQ